jgi:hypothetical protein
MLKMEWYRGKECLSVYEIDNIEEMKPFKYNCEKYE